MKKKVLAIMMSMIMALAVCTACGAKEDNKVSESSQKSDKSDKDSEKESQKDSESQKESELHQESEVDSDTETGSGIVEGEKFVDLMAYFNSQEVQDGLQELYDALKDSPMSLKISATSDTITYAYTYDTDMGLSTEELKDVIEESMKEQTEVFSGLADGMLPYVLIDKVNIQVIYYDSNGEVLYDGTFSSTK